MDLYREALDLFRETFARARRSDLREPSAMSLATADVQGRPSVRTVLLKDADERGFVFYTNTLSRKGEQLKANAHAALVFFWEPLGEQISVEGRTEPVSSDEADAYWVTRPRESQIGAWASLQSQPLQSREDLIRRVGEFTLKFDGHPVPRPPHWLGFRVIPDRMEFWVGHPFRLHDRVVYRRQDRSWTKTLLYP